MTLLLDRNITKGVHVLIIAVGQFDGNNFENLEGAALSAERLARWWLASDDRCLPKSKLGSVEVLISAPSPVTLPTDSGSQVEVEPAILENVLNRIKEWVARAKYEGAIPIFHWIGHGQVFGQTEGLEQALYCQDLMQVGDENLQCGIDLRQTLRGFASHLKSHAICFIDTCQSLKIKGSISSLEKPLTWNLKNGLPKPIVIRAASMFERTYCVGANMSVAGDFTGGALFSEAIRLALDRFGGRLVRALQTEAFPYEIYAAARRRLERWNQTVAFLRDSTPNPEIENSAPHSSFLTIPRPMSMVRFRLEDSARGYFSNFDFAPNSADGPHKADGRLWDYDLEYRKDWNVKVGTKTSPLSNVLVVDHPSFETFSHSHEEIVDPRGSK